MRHSHADIERHNAVQRAHFAREPTENSRMRPVDTPYVQRHVDRVIGAAGLELGDRILEVGCGMGKFTLPLAERGFAVEGLDLSQELVDELRRQLPDGLAVPLHVGDVLEAPDGLRGRFDVVMALFTLHHLIDLPSSFSAMRAYLRPGGRVVFLEPNAFNPLYYLQITATPSMSWRSDKGLINMTRHKLTSGLQQSGYVDIRHEWTGLFPPQITNRSWGGPLEDRIDRLGGLGPLSAFQVVTARIPDRPPDATD